MRVRSTLLVLLVAIGGCREQSTAVAPSDPAPAPRASPRTGGPRSPRSQTELPTDSSEAAGSALNARIAAADRQLLSTPTPSAQAALSSLLLLSSRLEGGIAAAERAEALAEAAARSAPRDPVALLARARVRAHFQRWPEALADLDDAAASGANTDEADRLRASVYEAQGRFAESRPLRERLARSSRFEDLESLAVLDGHQGRLEAAERGFSTALDHLPDRSPMAAATLWLDEATLWYREGGPARSRELLAAAVERMPSLWQAVLQLAILEAHFRDRDRALALLRPLAERSDDPEPSAQLADMLPESEDPKGERNVLLARAKARWAELVTRHPRAFAARAARFHLGVGGDPARGYQLAEEAFTAVATVDTARLLLDAALATQRSPRACEAADALLRLAPDSATARHKAWRAFMACGQKERAGALLSERR